MAFLVGAIVVLLCLVVLRLGTIAKQQRNLSEGWATVLDGLITPKDIPMVRGEPFRFPFSYMSDITQPRSVFDQIGRQLEEISMTQEEMKEELKGIRSFQEQSSKSQTHHDLVRAVDTFQAASETRHYDVRAIRMSFDEMNRTLSVIEETQTRIREDVNQIKNSGPLNPMPFR